MAVNQRLRLRRRGPRRRGFISGSLLALVLVTLTVSLSLGRALAFAVERANHDMDALKGALIFERTLLELDLGLTPAPGASGNFSVHIETWPQPDGSRRFRVRLKDRSTVREEVWLNSAGSS